MVGIEGDFFPGREIPEKIINDPEIIKVSGVITLFNLGDNLAIMNRNQRILDARQAQVKSQEKQSNS